MSAQADIGTVLDLVLAQASTTPGRAAVIDTARSMSYGELWDHSGEVARALVAAGIKKGDVVAVALTRDSAAISALLGVLRSGAVYLPLDPTYPEDRTSFMLADSGCQAVLLCAGSAVQEGMKGLHVVDLADLDHTENRELALPGVSGSDSAYLLYTSGSTGRPKGVLMPHAGLMNVITWQISDSRCTRDDRTLQYSPLSFDVSLQEIFATLGQGAELVCIDADTRADPHSLWLYVHAMVVNRIFMPYAALQSLASSLASLPELPSCLREVITAGEQLRCDQNIKKLFGRLKDCRLVNQYGPVETHVVTRYQLQSDSNLWELLPPIGTELPGLSVSVRDNAGEVYADGQHGEIWLAGIGLASGYRGRAELTSEKFPTLRNGTRAYRTGDVGYVENGLLWFVGRMDSQLKISGYRVEPAEIEAVITDRPGVTGAAVVATGQPAHLVAHVATSDPTSVQELRNYLEKVLPSHMVPSQIVGHRALPMTPSGKVDRLALQTSSSLGRESDASSAGPTVADQIRRHLGTNIDLGQGFVRAGGTSLLAAKIASEWFEATGVRLSIRSLMLGDGTIAPASATSRRDVMLRKFVAPGVRQMVVRDLTRGVAQQHTVAFGMSVQPATSTEALQQAVERVIARHESLRGRFAVRAMGVELEPDGLPPRPWVRWRDGGDAFAFDLRLSTRPFGSITQKSSSTKLTLVLHHAVCDGESLGLLFDAIADELDGVASPETRQPAHPPAFAAGRESRDYWTAMARSKPGFSRSVPRNAGTMTRVWQTSSAALAPGIYAAAARAGVTPFVLQTAAWAQSAADRQAEAFSQVSAVAVSERSSAGWGGVGNFVDMVPLLLDDLAGSSGFASVLHVQRRLLEARDYLPAATALPLKDDARAGLLSSATSAIASQPSLRGPRTLRDGRVCRDLATNAEPEPSSFPIVLGIAEDGEDANWIDVDEGVTTLEAVAERLARWKSRLNALCARDDVP